MIFSEEDFSRIVYLCQNKSQDTSLLKTLLNQMLEFKKDYDNSKGKTRGVKRVCKAADCYKIFYDFERKTRYCVEHSLTPYSPKFLQFYKRIKDLIRINSRVSIFKEDAWNNENRIRWLRFYREDKENAIDFKRRNNEIIKSIFCEVEPLLDKNIMICSVPSSTPGNIDTGINHLVKILTAQKRTNVSNCLVRINSRLRNSSGGDRSIQNQLQTLKLCEQHKIENHTILLLDDITTTGNSLEACSQILLGGGAIDVYKFAVWKAGRIND